MEEGTTRKERRRRRAEKTTDDEFQKIIENSEFRETQSSDDLTRKDTYKVPKSKSDMHVSANLSTESSDCLTYNVDKTSGESEHGTYNIEEPRPRPIPAPRKKRPLLVSQEKVSSDTDKDITEIDMDDQKTKPEAKARHVQISQATIQDSDQSTESLVVVPTPKPRNMSFERKIEHPKMMKFTKSKSLNSLNVKKESLDKRTVKSDVEIDLKTGEESADHSTLDPNELPLIADLQAKNLSIDVNKKKKKARVVVAEFLDRKNTKEKSRKKFSSIMKLDGGKIHKISSILKEKKVEEVEPKIDFSLDSPQYPKSVDNGNIYVQSKNGFRLMGREEVLKSGSSASEDTGNTGMTEGATVKTAIMYQKFWSKLMTCFHGVLAGFAFSHAAIVTGIMILYNYNPRKFIDFYSCLCYILFTSSCALPTFEKPLGFGIINKRPIDVGHMNRKHWQTAWKVPSMWLIVSFYLVSFALTFANQKTETRFDAYLHGNATDADIWNTNATSDIQVNIISWYHVSWARDVLVLLAWFVISLTDFTDFLTSHLSNMLKYADVKTDNTNQISARETHYL